MKKHFFNETIIAATVSSDTDAAQLEKKLLIYNAFQYERVGFNLRPELLVLKDAGNGKDAFAALAKIIAEKSEFNLVLMTEDLDVMKAGVETAGFKRPLLYAATKDSIDALGALAKDNDLPLAVKADSVADLIPLTEKLLEMDVKDIVIDSGAREIKQALEDQVAIRRAALKDSNRSLGIPTSSPANLPAAHAVRTLNPSESLISNQVGTLLASISPETIK